MADRVRSALTEGARNYWKSHDFSEIADGLVDTLLSAVRTLPTAECESFVASLGGAINRIPPDATAYPHRDVEFVVNVHTRWSDPSEDQACIAWARKFYAAARVRTGAYGSNYDRLARIKARYDPQHLFRANQNVVPVA